MSEKVFEVFFKKNDCDITVHVTAESVKNVVDHYCKWCEGYEIIKVAFVCDIHEKIVSKNESV